jgi:hypothetical protein
MPSLFARSVVTTTAGDGWMADLDYRLAILGATSISIDQLNAMNNAIGGPANAGNPFLTKNDPNRLTDNEKAAMTNASPPPSAANPVVTSSDLRIASGSGIGGAYITTFNTSTTASAPAIIGDGTTNDGPAIQTFAATVNASNGGTGGHMMWTAGMTYRMTTATLVDYKVSNFIPQGAMLVADGAFVTIRGPIMAGPYQIFKEINGGRFFFQLSTEGNSNSKLRARFTEAYPEWWGAIPDGTTDCGPAIQSMFNAACGYGSGGTPLNPATTARYSNFQMRFGVGCYRSTIPLAILSARGIRIEGSGADASIIRYWPGVNYNFTASGGTTTTIVVYLTSGTATSGTASTLADTTKTFVVNTYAGKTLKITGGTGSGQSAVIVSNTATTFTITGTWGVTPDATSTYGVSIGWTTNQFAPTSYGTPWYIYCYAGTNNVGFQKQIVSNTDDTITLTGTPAPVPFDSTSQFYLGPQAVLDLNGVSNMQIDHIGVEGIVTSGFGNVAYPMRTIYYHWNNVTAAASSSSCHFICVRVAGCFVSSGMWFGGIDGDIAGKQADNVYLTDCEVRPQNPATWTDAGQLAQVGIGFGDGSSANALNYHSTGGIVTTTGVGYLVSSTNAMILGGDVEDNDVAFLMNNTISYCEISNIRVETTHMLLSHQGTQGAAGAVILRDILFNLNAPRNEYRLNRDLPLLAETQGYTRFENIRAGSPTLYLAPVDGTPGANTSTTVTPTNGPVTTGGPTITGTPIPTTVGAGPLSANRCSRRGWNIEIVNGTGTGQMRQVLSNTSTVYTIDPPWDTIPDATSVIRLSIRPRILIHNGTCEFSGAVYGIPYEQFLLIDTNQTGQARGDLKLFTPLNAQSTGGPSGIATSGVPNGSPGFGGTVTTGLGIFQNQSGYTQREKIFFSMADFVAGATNNPNTTTAILQSTPSLNALCYNHAKGVVTIPTFEACAFIVNTLGQPPAPSVIKTGHTLSSTVTNWYTPNISGGASTLTDLGRTMTVNQWAGGTITLTSGTGNGQVKTIASNTATVITTTTPWGTVPDSTTRYTLTGGTSYTYYIVPKAALYDGTNTYVSGIASPAVTVTGCCAVLDALNFNTISAGNGDHGPLSVYDVLRGDTAHSIATNVNFAHMPWQDMRNAPGVAYTYTGVDNSGLSKLAGPVIMGSTASIAGDITMNGTTNTIHPLALKPKTIAFSTTPVFDCNATTGGGDFEMQPLTANVTASSLINMRFGQILTFLIPQDAVGGRNFVWPVNLIGPPTISSGANSVTAIMAVVKQDGKAYVIAGAAAGGVAAALVTAGDFQSGSYGFPGPVRFDDTITSTKASGNALVTHAGSTSIFNGTAQFPGNIVGPVEATGAWQFDSTVQINGLLTPLGGVSSNLLVSQHNASFTIGSNEQIIEIDSSGGNVVVTSYLAATDRKPHLLIKTSSDSNTVTVNRVGADTFSGGLTSISMTTQGACFDICPDGTATWLINRPALPARFIQAGTFGPGAYTYDNNSPVTLNATATFNAAHVMNGAEIREDKDFTTFGATGIIDFAQAPCGHAVMTPSTACTLTLQNMVAGSHMRMRFQQDPGTGGATLTAVAGWTPGGLTVKPTPPALSAGAGKSDWVDLYYDGTTLWWNAYLTNV